MHGYGQGMEKVDGSSLLNLEKGFLHLQFIFLSPNMEIGMEI